MTANEKNTRVTLKEFLEVRFDAQDELMNARFDASDAKISAHAQLDEQKWEAHNETHRRERGLIAIVGVVCTSIVTWFGMRFPTK